MPRLPPAILAGDAMRVQEILEGLLLLHSSHHDLSRPELFYHAFVLGLLVELEETHHVRSNREVAYGRSDIQIFPKKPGDPGVVIEFTAGPEAQGEALAEAALLQITERRYTAELEAAGVSPIRKLGISFSGKKVVVRGA